MVMSVFLHESEGFAGKCMDFPCSVCKRTYDGNEDFMDLQDSTYKVIEGKALI